MMPPGSFGYGDIRSHMSHRISFTIELEKLKHVTKCVAFIESTSPLQKSK